MLEFRPGSTKYGCLAAGARDKRRSAGAENLSSLRGAREEGHAPTPREVETDSGTRGRRGFSVASPGLQRTWSDPWRPGWGRRPRKRDRAPTRRRQPRNHPKPWTARPHGAARLSPRQPALALRPGRRGLTSVPSGLPRPGPGGPYPRSLGPPRGSSARAGRRSRAGREDDFADRLGGGPRRRPPVHRPCPRSRPGRRCRTAKPPKGSAILGCRRLGTLHQAGACEATALAATRRIRMHIKTSRLAGRRQPESSPPR